MDPPPVSDRATQHETSARRVFGVQLPDVARRGGRHVVGVVRVQRQARRLLDEEIIQVKDRILPPATGSVLVLTPRARLLCAVIDMSRERAGGKYFSPA